MSPRRGRPPKYCEDPQTGQPVVGLSKHKVHGFYYNTHFKTENVKMHNFGTDRNVAIFEFRLWMSRRGREETIGINIEDMEQEVAEVTEKDGEYYFGRKDFGISESLFWRKARQLILQDIHAARKKLNLPIEIVGSVKLTKSVSLERIGDLFFQRKELSGKTKRYLRESKVYWKEFISYSGARRARDVTIEAVDTYQDRIREIANRKKWKGSSINNRFSLVKGVFKAALKYLQNHAEIDEVKNVRDYLNRLEGVKKSKFEPQPVSKEDYRRFLDNERSPTYKALLLVALNCAMRQANLVEIRKKHIDLKRKVLQMPRPKTGVIRSAVLWDRTVLAIREMQKSVPNRTDHLFISEKGGPLSRKTVEDWFRRRRTQLGISKKVKFEQLRDSASTIPIWAGVAKPHEITVLLGHLLPWPAPQNLIHQL